MRRWSKNSAKSIRRRYARKPGPPKRVRTAISKGLVRASDESLKKYEVIAKEFVREGKPLADLFEQAGFSRKTGEKGLNQVKRGMPTLYSMILQEYREAYGDPIPAAIAKARLYRLKNIKADDLHDMYHAQLVSNIGKGEDEAIESVKTLGKELGYLGADAGITVNLGEMPQEMKQRYETWRASLPQPQDALSEPPAESDTTPSIDDTKHEETPALRSDDGEGSAT